jgi:hypothetical protein
MDQLIVLAVFGAIVVGSVVGGIRLGMLLAPRIGRLSEPNDEDDGADDD